MKSVGIIGAGFSGMMTAVQLVNKAEEPLEVVLINEKPTFGKGPAYHPYSQHHLLNVAVAKMSAYPDQPDHFLHWVMEQPAFSNKDRALIGQAYLPRMLYGTYLDAIWKATQQQANAGQVKPQVIHHRVEQLQLLDDGVMLGLENGTRIEVDDCIIATGNHIPRNPTIKNSSFYDSPHYFQNPWVETAVRTEDLGQPVVIIGNGLTMIDTVFGLLEHGFKGTIHSLSPNGFRMLPHRHSGFTYTKLVEELEEGMGLHALVTLIRKHISIVREYGVSADPVIESLRPHTSRIWRSFSLEEKRKFMSRLRPFWNAGRHRIPLPSYDRIRQLQKEGRLKPHAGRIADITASTQGITVTYHENGGNGLQRLQVGRVINCTGPETNLMNLDTSFLKECVLNGMLTQDALKLGIKADVQTYRVLNADHEPHPHLYTIGLNLKGELWESTSVRELREQAAQVARIILNENTGDA